MSDPVNLISTAALRLRQSAALLGRSLARAILARATRRALTELPDDLLRDIGLMRGDIAFVADAIASGDRDLNRDARDRLDNGTTQRGVAPRHWPSGGLRHACVVMAAVSMVVMTSSAVLAQDAPIKRGQYLVTLGGCTDCHTPGYFFGKPDMTRYLGGSEVGFEIPGLGVFHGPNLTPEPETGLGKWSAEEIGKAITTGKRPDGRILAPIMPSHAFANLTGEDVRAMVAFLKSLPPVKNQVPGPFGPSEKPSSFVMKIAAPEPAAKP